MRIIHLLTFFTLISVTAQSQMVVGTDTLYGNEWIDYDKSYWKIKVADDGVKRITFEMLEDFGFPSSETTGQNLHLFSLGEQVPLHVSTNGTFSAGDYIEFFGHKNRGELDEHLFADSSYPLNPEYSLFSDTSVYFLTYDNTVAGVRLEDNPIGAGNFNPQEYYLHEEKIVFNDWHHKPNYADNVRYSHFHVAEGYGTTLKSNNQYSLPSSNVVETTFAKPKATLRFGSNYRNHIVEFIINNELKENENYFGFATKQYEVEMEYDELKNTNVFQLKGTSDNSDRFSLAFGKLQYPRTPSFDTNVFEFLVGESTFEKSFEFETNGSNYIIYDEHNQNRTVGDTSTGTLRFRVKSGPERKIYISKVDEFSEVSSVSAKTFVDIRNINAEFLFVTSSKLYNPQDPENQVTAYADYRSSMAGGSFSTHILTADNIIDQFAYGIERHCIGNKNLAFYLKNEWPNLKYWYNVGKGIEYNAIRFADNTSTILQNRFHVPTFGIPGSDNMMLSGKEVPDPLYNVGRIAVTTEEELEDYLDKVKAHDNKEMWEHTFEEKYWLKQILHLSGGDPGIQESIFIALEAMRNEIENNNYGADVSTFRKTSSSPIQPAEIDELINLINSGLSIITFFGHSAVGTFDFNLQQPKDWENKDKYPFILSLGCFSGNIHTSSTGLSEEYLLQQERGAIAFLASSGTAYVGPQAIGGENLYEKIGKTHIDKSLSEAIRAYIQDNISNVSIGYRTLMQQLTFHGDPAIRLFDFKGPDFVFDYSSISTSPEIIDNSLDSFELEVTVANLGKFVPGDLGVKIQYFSSDDSLRFETNQVIEAPNFKTTFQVSIPVLAEPGKRIIKGTIDYDNQFNEEPSPFAELNNEIVNTSNGEIGFCLFATDNSLQPICPLDFGIWNKQEVKLFSSTNNAFDENEGTYLLEIDTLMSFDSPALEKMLKTNKGGLLTWEPTTSFEKGTVYYWRVSPDSISAEQSYMWRTSSFLYNPEDEYGWNQSHKHQYDQDILNGIVVKDQLEFDTTGFYITIRNGFPSATTGYFFNFETNATSVRPWSFMDSGVAIVVGDSKTGSAWINGGGDYGSINTNNSGGQRVFGFPTSTPEERQKVVDFLSNDIPDGNFVWFWTIVKNNLSNFYPEEWSGDVSIYGGSIFEELTNQGGQKHLELENLGSVPYGMVYQKGVSVLNEEIASSMDEEITIESFVPLKDNNGMMRSVLIGPAKKWDRIEIEFNNVISTDTLLVKAFGMSYQNNPIFLGELTGTGSIDLQGANEESLRYIYLEYSAKDIENKDPGDLTFWKAYYDGFPDIALDFYSEELKESFSQGEPIEFSYFIQNVSDFAILDSFNIKYILIDESNIETVLVKKQAGLAAGERRLVNFEYSNSNLIGNYSLSILVNEDVLIEEKNMTNNFALTRFEIVEDKTNPILNVTFDGVDILDGDIVAPKPFIRIELKDENLFLLNEDIDQFELTLIDPNNNEISLDLSDPTISFIPQTEVGSPAIIEFSPCFEMEGEYCLKVSADDASGNSSGMNDWQRKFNVHLTEAISEALFYPNPFSTSSRLVFTLTGSVPEVFHLKIYTLSGKLIREVDQNEIGALRVGVNQTSFNWDGTDMYGNKLANGVYLYKIYTQDDFEKFDTGSQLSQYFTDGFGKVVIMR